MYFGPGTAAGSPTFNIRSPRATGVCEFTPDYSCMSSALTGFIQSNKSLKRLNAQNY